MLFVYPVAAKAYPALMVHPRYVPLLLIFASACTSCGAEDPIDALIRSHMAKHSIPGLAVAIVKDGQVVRTQGYGAANVETNQPVKADTVFPILSVTKQFTAAGIMLLVEEGKIGLDDPIHRYFESAPPTWGKIMVRHLLTHTSGIKDFINEPNLDLTRDYTETEILQSAVGRPLNFEPGDAWAYSNTNYHLLAMIIRKVSGQWYGDFLAERIFNPLGMTRTWVVRGGETETNMAQGYVRQDDKLRPALTLPPGIAGYGGGGIHSTVEDMARWDIALNSERLLKRQSLGQMWEPVRLNSGASHGYGFGWEISSIDGHRVVWHAGGWTGFSAQISRLPEDRLTVIVLTNLRSGAPGELARAIAATYIPKLTTVKNEPIEDTDPALSARLSEIVRRAAEGTLAADDFTPETWTALTPYRDQLRRDLQSFGPMQSFAPIERTERDGLRHLRYRVQFQRTQIVFQFTLNSEGKLTTFTPEAPTQ